MKMIRNCSRTKIAIKEYNNRKIRLCSSLTELQKSKVYALSSNKVKLLSFVNSLLVIFILEVNHIECLVFLFSWENPVPTYSFQTIF
jgi:hypothetical protein